MAAFYVAVLPPAKLRASNGDDGDEQHNEGGFSHLCSRSRVTTDKTMLKPPPL